MAINPDAARFVWIRLEPDTQPVSRARRVNLSKQWPQLGEW